MAAPKPTYCFDTSALTEWWIRRYPPDVLPGLVIRMEQLITDGRAIIPSFVLAELEEGGDDLFHWAKAQKGFTVNEEAPVQEFATRLLAEYHDPDKPTKGIGNADPFVIALAASVNPHRTVITAENAGSIENPKIPFVCKRLKIGCITFLEMMRVENWKLK